MGDYAQPTAQNTPASAPGVRIPNTAPAGAQMPTHVTPDQVPKLDDPTGRPNEPLTAGLDMGAGAGPEAIGPLPPNPAIQNVQAAYLANPTPQLRRVLARLRSEGLL